MKLVTARYNPITDTSYSPFAQLSQELDRWFDAANTQAPATENQIAYAPPLDIRETAEAYVFQADLPGVERKDVVLTLQEGVLTISGERKPQAEVKEGEYSRFERGHGRFQRQVKLPKPVQADTVTATYKDGVLTVTVPKAAEAKPRQIDISSN